MVCCAHVTVDGLKTWLAAAAWRGLCRSKSWTVLGEVCDSCRRWMRWKLYYLTTIFCNCNATNKLKQIHESMSNNYKLELKPFFETVTCIKNVLFVYVYNFPKQDLIPAVRYQLIGRSCFPWSWSVIGRQNHMSLNMDMGIQSSFKLDWIVVFSLVLDAQYKSYYPQYHQPLQMLLGKPLYLEVRLLNTPDPSLVLLVHFCVAYPRSGKAVWLILYNGYA